MQMHGFVTKLFYFSIRIFSFQGGEIDHIQHQLQPIQFRFFFNTSFGKPGCSFFGTYLVNPGRKGEIGEE